MYKVQALQTEKYFLLFWKFETNILSFIALSWNLDSIFPGRGSYRRSGTGSRRGVLRVDAMSAWQQRGEYPGGTRGSI